MAVAAPPIHQIQLDIQSATQADLLATLENVYREHNPSPRPTSLLLLSGDADRLENYEQKRIVSPEDDLWLLDGVDQSVTHSGPFLRQLFATPPGGILLVYRGGLLGPAGVELPETLYPSTGTPGEILGYSPLDPPYRQAHSLSRQPGIDFAAVATRYTRGGLTVVYSDGEREQFRVR